MCHVAGRANQAAARYRCDRMKLLCAADLHLGRRPSRLPVELADIPGLQAELTPQATWRRLVDLAITEQVTAVLLAGDLLDDEHDYFETFGDLRAGVERLIDAGVAVLAVSGNHDVGVLPRLAAAVPGLTMLGAGGAWEVATLVDDDVTVHVAGWSYPQPVVDASPVPLLAPALDGLSPGTTIALLHCDRDQTGSRYAPVTSRELRAAPVDAWLLGHVHKPDFGPFESGGGSASGRSGGYLGAISPADPGEEGAYGAWLLEVTGSGRERLTSRHLPLAALRYETLVVDVESMTATDDLVTAVSSAVAELGAELSASWAPELPSRAVGVRVRLTGRSHVRSELAAALAKDDPRRLLLRLGEAGELVAFVHDHRFDVRAAHDLVELAAGHDPVALTARKVLLLDDESDPRRAALLEKARSDLGATGSGTYYRALPPPDLSDAALTDLLRRAALDLLDAMLASRSAA